MLLADVLKYFGNGYGFEKSTGLSHANINYWTKLGYIPIVSQMKIEKRTDGALKADMEHTNEGK
jgi:hypothetical protein